MGGGSFNSVDEPCSIAWRYIEFLPIRTPSNHHQAFQGKYIHLMTVSR